MSTLTGSATEPTSSLTVPTVGGDTDTWGDTLNDTTLQALLNYVLWLRDRVPLSESKVSATAHGFNVGDVLRHNGTTWTEATADTAGNAIAAGVVTNVPDVDTFVIAHAGLVSGLSGLTVGSVHYLQDAGGLGTTAGTVTVPVLLAVSATSGVLLSLSSAVSGGGSGDVTGPAGATAGNFPDFDDTTGKALGDSGVGPSDFATAAQGALADTAVQPGDPVSTNAQTGTSYTLVLGDAGKLVTCENAGAITLTIPANASVAFDVGTVIAVAQLGAGAVTIQGDTGVTVNGTSAGSEPLSAQYATASLIKLASDTWLVAGGLA